MLSLLTIPMDKSGAVLLAKKYEGMKEMSDKNWENYEIFDKHLTILPRISIWKHLSEIENKLLNAGL